MKTAIASFLEPKRLLKLYDRLSSGSCINLHAQHTEPLKHPFFYSERTEKDFLNRRPAFECCGFSMCAAAARSAGRFNKRHISRSFR